MLVVSSTCTDIQYKFLSISKLVRTLPVVSVVVATTMSADKATERNGTYIVTRQPAWETRYSVRRSRRGVFR